MLPFVLDILPGAMRVRCPDEPHAIATGVVALLILVVGFPVVGWDSNRRLSLLWLATLLPPGMLLLSTAGIGNLATCIMLCFPLKKQTGTN